MTIGGFSFFVIHRRKDVPVTAQSGAYLFADDCSDSGFRTQFNLVVVDRLGKQVEIGLVKIGQFSLTANAGTPVLPASFHALDESFFSLGQDESYYRRVAKLGGATRNALLNGLRDLVFNRRLLPAALTESVTRKSLLRLVGQKSIHGQFSRVLYGGARLSNFSFDFRLPGQSRGDADKLTFDVIAESQPPTNSGPRYAYIGLKQATPDNHGEPKSHRQLADDFAESVQNVLKGARRERWNRALDALEVDPIFRDANVREIAVGPKASVVERHARKCFGSLRT